jgi:hypothetical protein
LGGGVKKDEKEPVEEAPADNKFTSHQAETTEEKEIPEETQPEGEAGKENETTSKTEA